ncbi:hypothetical protein ACFLZK_00095 [Patescibacteria group bacterium]
MRRIITSVVVTFVFLMLVVPVLAAPKSKMVYTEWSWKGEKSGFFKLTGSELVHMWSYDRPNEEPDIHFVIKPSDKFPNASCDEEALKENAEWKPRNLYNVQNTSEYKEDFKTIFTDLDQLHYLCGYAIE